jgi:acyl carrier protein
MGRPVTRDQDLHTLISTLLATQQHPSADIEVTNATALAEGGLELTSLDLVRLFVGLEEQLEIDLEDSAMFELNFDTVADIVELVRSSAGRAHADAL